MSTRLHVGAAAPGPVTPTTVEAPDERTPGVEGQAVEVETERDDAILHEPDAERKRLATLTAHAALAGFQLHALDNGSFLISRWQWCKSLPDLDAAERFLVQAGVPV